MQTIKISSDKSASIDTTRVLVVESNNHELNLTLHMSGADLPLTIQFDDQQLFDDADLLLKGYNDDKTQEITK